MTSKIYYWIVTNKIDIIIFCDMCNTEEFEQLKNIVKTETYLGLLPIDIKNFINQDLNKKKMPFICEVSNRGICFYRSK